MLLSIVIYDSTCFHAWSMLVKHAPFYIVQCVVRRMNITILGGLMHSIAPFILYDDITLWNFGWQGPALINPRCIHITFSRLFSFEKVTVVAEGDERENKE